ncbi:GNAT family N-acetyltransferase [Streptomyces sp. SID8379]|uniref:GNAT family N-acetyltransferase n=1 Tax=unclassified Streptomyces TaxID=2593676 RepID=UPI00036DE2B2|nr:MULTISPECIES: GNAT family N-acetyltransferase [unclassified Streptomyces]MYW68026.1 GNAT family N-acetyltransferase [Streptomyces sp. SID8379]
MTGSLELGPVAWPPTAITTERLVLRAPEPRDRPALIELLSTPEVHTYLGGPHSRDDLERTVPETPHQRPGLFVAERDGALIGTVELKRTKGEYRSPIGQDGDAEIGYLFLPRAWGHGYAAEACAAALDWLATALPDEPVVLCTQTANTRSMRLARKLGFTEAERYEAWGAEQWMGIRTGR